MNVDVNLEQCVACAACSVACMDQNDTDIPGGEKPFRKIYNLELPQEDSRVRFLYLSVACMHCQTCVPMEKCPQTCFSRDEATGLVILDSSRCTGCGACMGLCSFHAITRFASDGRMHKCNGCIERVRHGYEPAYVRSCPKHAIVFTDAKALPLSVSLKGNPDFLKHLRGDYY